MTTISKDNYEIVYLERVYNILNILKIILIVIIFLYLVYIYYIAKSYYNRFISYF